MRFLIDAQLPPALTGWLSEQAHHAEHVAAIGLLSASDTAIAAHAAKHGLVLLSKDEDFLVLRRVHPFRFVWLRCGNCTNRALINWLRARWPAALALLQSGNGLVELQ